MKKLIIIYSLIYLSVFSCKSQKLSLQERDSHLILEKTFNDRYNKIGINKGVNLDIYTRNINLDIINRYIHTIKVINEAEATVDINIDMTWFNDFNDLEKLIDESRFEFWNPELFEIENLNYKFELTQTDNVGYLREKIAKDSLDDKKAYEMKMVYWVKENYTFNILSATPPIFSRNGNKAMLFTSMHHNGLVAWLFEKKDNDWEVMTKLDIAFY